jgi:glucose/arabinose dehydrogenase
MVAYRGALYVVEPNHGEVDRVTPAGRITRVVDVSRSQGHIVPTAIAESRGVLYLGNLGTFPVRPHTERVLRLAGGRRLRTVARRLTAVVGLAFHRGHLYVLESTTRPGLPTRPGSGKVVELLPNGRQQLIAFDFDFPTAMTFGPDGALYVANRGFGFPAGFGEIVRIGVR